MGLPGRMVILFPSMLFDRQFLLQIIDLFLKAELLLMELDLTIPYLIRIVSPFLLKIALQVLIDNHDLLIFLLEPHNLVDSLLQLIDMAEIILLFGLVLLEDAVPGGQISFVLVDCLLQETDFIGDVDDYGVLFAYALF